jgi:multimeric flavodoxin WrbA
MAGLLIHDLPKEEWEKIKDRYDGWTVVTETSPVKPCIGCFGCWDKTPGQCVVKDGYDKMGRLVHEASEIRVISRYTFGGFSGPVKGIIDRCIGYVLPQFTVTGGETHHKKRYDEDKPFTFIFYGPGLSEEEKEGARKYAKALCANFRCHVKEVLFREDGEASEAPLRPEHSKEGKTVLLNASMRTKTGNSARFARYLKEFLSSSSEILDLKDCLGKFPELVKMLEDAEKLVICTPLYVDGLPSQLIRLMEEITKSYEGERIKVYVLTNMGLYESSQLKNLFGAVKRWCRIMGFEYCGGLGISAGELLGTLFRAGDPKKGATANAAEGIEKLARAIEGKSSMDDTFAEPRMFPKWLYILIANVNWRRLARKNGIKPRDLYR